MSKVGKRLIKAAKEGIKIARDPNIKYLTRTISSVRAENKALKAQLSDYAHYADTYGNMNGECETGYPQHPGYICGMCGQDRSVSRTCLRKK